MQIDATSQTKTFFGSCPLDCPDTCSWVVTVEDGKAVKLVGNRDHPITRGGLCGKVSRYLEYAAAPDRIIYPLIRTCAKGAGEFRRATWDEALDVIAQRMQHDIKTYGGESIWPHYGSGHFGAINGVYGSGRRFFNVIGASQNAVTSCSIAGEYGAAYTIGWSAGLDPETISAAKLILLWGTNTISTNMHFLHILNQARKNGARIICIDPVRTRTAEYADEYIPIRPGTDAALALALMNVIVKLNAQDEEFIQKYTIGWEQLRDRIMEYSPTKVAQITGIPESEIVRLGKLIAMTRPTAIRSTQGIQRHAGGGMAIRTLMCLAGVTGDWKHPGGGVSYDIGGLFRGNWEKLWRDDLRPKETRTLVVTRLGEGLLELNDPPVKTLFIWIANPLASSPHTTKIEQGLHREDLFTVVIDHFMTETAKYADVFLPSTMQTEHSDLHWGYGHIYASWNQKAIDPPGECLNTAEIFRQLARRMNLEEPCLYDSDETLACALLDSDDPVMQGVTLECLKTEGFVRLNYATPNTALSIGFNTPSQKLEFYSQTMADDGLDPLPTYTPPKEAVADDGNMGEHFPFALVTPASHYFLNSIFANFSASTKREGEPFVAIHPKDAQLRQLSEGDLVEVFNDRGSYTAHVHVSDIVQPGVLMSPKGHWRGADGRFNNVNATVDERDSDMGRGAVYHDNRVDIRCL